MKMSCVMVMIEWFWLVPGYLQVGKPGAEICEYRHGCLCKGRAMARGRCPVEEYG